MISPKWSGSMKKVESNKGIEDLKGLRRGNPVAGRNHYHSNLILNDPSVVRTLFQLYINTDMWSQDMDLSIHKDGEQKFMIDREFFENTVLPALSENSVSLSMKEDIVNMDRIEDRDKKILYDIYYSTNILPFVIDCDDSDHTLSLGKHQLDILREEEYESEVQNIK